MNETVVRMHFCYSYHMYYDRMIHAIQELMQTQIIKQPQVFATGDMEFSQDMRGEQTLISMGTIRCLDADKNRSPIFNTNVLVRFVCFKVL